jgi:hypothetical protein
MPSSISSSRPLALLLGLGLFIAAEQWLWSSAVVARRLLAIQPASASADAMGVAARIRLMNADQTPPLILLGSSQIREGLDCDILAGAPGLGPCVNLGIGGGAPLDLLHISRELGDGPRTLVVAIFPGVVSKSPKSGFIDTSTVRALAASGVWSRITPDDWRLLETGLAQTLSPTLASRSPARGLSGEGGGLAATARGAPPFPSRGAPPTPTESPRSISPTASTGSTPIMPSPGSHPLRASPSTG